MKSILANTLFVSLFVLPVVSTEAQPGPTPQEKKPAEVKPSPETVAKARTAFLAGKVAHDAKKYTLASEKYTEAYKLYPQPLFLYNIAQVKRLDGDKEGALRHYEEYLAADPKGRGAKNSRQIVRELRQQIAKEKAQADAKATIDAKAKSTADAKAKAEADAKMSAEADAKMSAEADAKMSAEADARAAALLNPSVRPPTSNPGRGLKIAGLSTASLGLISLGVSGFFFSSAQSKQDELGDFNGIWTAREQKTFDDGESADRFAVISAGVGGAAIVSGALLYWLGSRQRSNSESLVVIPISVRGSTGIGLHTGF